MVEVRPALEEQLVDLDNEQLQALLLNLANRVPGLIDDIETQLALIQPAPTIPQAEQTTPSPARHTPVDPQPIRRRVRSIFNALDYGHPSEAYWQVSGVVNEIHQFLHQAKTFVEGGDGQNALTILEAITDEYVEGWTILDDSDGDASAFFDDLGPIWTEAILTADLTATERKQWIKKLKEWQDEISDYGVEEVFEAAQAAAKHGWDYPPLQRVLQGEITDKGAWLGEAPWYADDLSIARLNVLERQGRYQEYLYLAEAEGQMGLYLTMLARVGRIQEAVDEGLQYLTTTDEALMLASALRDRGNLEEALRIAEHGLTLEGSKEVLASWISDLASGMGKNDSALQAIRIAFNEAPSLATYLRVQELAGEGWTEIRSELLTHLRRTTFYFPQAKVDIFLHEGLLDDAIAAVQGTPDYDLIEQVVDATIEHRPDWVIKAARQQAEQIMNAGRADIYHHALHWLEKAREAYRIASREDEWREYLQEVRTIHKKKYKLMGLLKTLGE
jgi:uncharacterized Zn finger protein